SWLGDATQVAIGLRGAPCWQAASDSTHAASRKRRSKVRMPGLQPQRGGIASRRRDRVCLPWKNRRAACAARPHLVGEVWSILRSELVGRFAVRDDVQALALLLVAHAQP